MFVINGGSYAVTAPIFGVLCDKFISPIYINLGEEVIRIFFYIDNYSILFLLQLDAF